jgi:hypothetical protein
MRSYAADRAKARENQNRSQQREFSKGSTFVQGGARPQNHIAPRKRGNTLTDCMI